MSNVGAIVAECRRLQAELIPQGDKLKVRAPTPLSQDLIETLRQHKAEVLAFLTRPRVSVNASNVDAPPEWHAEEIERRVEGDGLCIFWADLFGEVVAFIADESFRGQVPSGVVCYTVKELELFGNSDLLLSKTALTLIHQAKKVSGGMVLHNEPE